MKDKRPVERKLIATVAIRGKFAEIRGIDGEPAFKKAISSLTVSGKDGVKIIEMGKLVI